MRTPLFFTLLSCLLVVACKKNNPKPLSSTVGPYLTHSGIIGSEACVLNTAPVSAKLIKMEQSDDAQNKNFRIRTWLKGPDLMEITNGEEKLTLDLSFRMLYDPSEYDSTCNCLPTPDASRLANHINDPSIGWNDPSHRKEILVISWDGSFGSGAFHAINPHISAQVKGAFIKIYGTIDSLEVIPNRYLKNFSFDYLVPINP